MSRDVGRREQRLDSRLDCLQRNRHFDTGNLSYFLTILRGFKTFFNRTEL